MTNQKISGAIWQLVLYGVETKLITKEEMDYTANLLLDVMKESGFYCSKYREENEPENVMPVIARPREERLEQILSVLLQCAIDKGLCEDNQTERDLFDTKLMNCLTPRPSQITQRFWERYGEHPKKATDYFYRLCNNSDYIRSYRTARDIRWTVASDYGCMDISINLAKPEKDPKVIAAALNSQDNDYPRCMLCKENVGYAGRLDYPSKKTLRVIPIRMNGEEWEFQYSPYVYYNEHCIVLDSLHRPMKISRDTFVHLLNFVKSFPHYFLGSNADLPIVGGSILSHNHYQGGSYEFPMARAPLEEVITIPGFSDVNCAIVRWPMSVLRISGRNEENVIALAEYIRKSWLKYSDESVSIHAQTDGVNHNTITPIARIRNHQYELDLVLRNNRTTTEHPLGLFHPHEKLHHIKKENIGLIEVMGLAVLPARLKEEMEIITQLVLDDKDLRSDERVAKHADWVEDIFEYSRENVMEKNSTEYSCKSKHMDADEIMFILKAEIGKVFIEVLEDAGVFKRDHEGKSAFLRFLRTL